MKAGKHRLTLSSSHLLVCDTRALSRKCKMGPKQTYNYLLQSDLAITALLAAC